MNAPQPETPATAPEERIGKYKVHPVASLFPSLPDDEYEDLKGSIEVMGQAYPIMVQGDVLLDGRNRMRACLELGVPPKLQEYRGTEKPEVFIEFVNLYRRHLGEDARASISAKIRMWCIAQQNAARQKEATKEGGRGHKKNSEMNSSPSLQEPKTRAKDARSTVGQIAEVAKVSHHKAAQAVAVGKAAPELLDQVAKGKVKLKDAHAAVKAAKPAAAKPARRSDYTYLDAKTRGLGKLQDVMRLLNTIYKAYPNKEGDLLDAVEKMIRSGPLPVGGVRLTF